MTEKTTEDANIDAELQSTNVVDVIDAAVKVADQTKAKKDKKAGSKRKAEEVESKDTKEGEDDEGKSAAEQALIKDIIDKNNSTDEPASKKQKKTGEEEEEKEDVIAAPLDKNDIVEPKLTQRKESHKEVERRRRETINVAINELKELCGEYLIQVNKAGFPHSATGHIHFSKSEILNAACGYIKNLKEKIKAVEADFDNYRYASKAELKSVTTANEALEDALNNEKKD